MKSTKSHKDDQVDPFADALDASYEEAADALFIRCSGPSGDMMAMILANLATHALRSDDARTVEAAQIAIVDALATIALES